MRGAALLLTLGLVGGCAQLAGIDETAKAPPADASVADSPNSDAVTDAFVCAGGDARAVDPQTGRCFVYFMSPLPRNAARGVCAGLGAGTFLASVQGGSENATVLALVGAATVFLGGNDEATEGVFMWEDGSPFQLTNWNIGEPNNGMAMYEEDCIVLHGSLNGVWDDRPCTTPAGTMLPGEYAFVCKR